MLRVIVSRVVFFLASIHQGFGQSGTKTWTQSRAVDFSANQLLNLSPVPSPGVGVQLSPPFAKTQGDQYDNFLLRFLAKDGAGNYVAATAIGGTVHAQRYSAAGIAGGPASRLPATFRLYQNYPNPFNPATTIDYEVPRMAQVSLTIFDLLGRRVATLVNGIRTPGRFSVEWNAVRQASGVYFCRMQAGNFAMTTKLLLVR